MAYYPYSNSPFGTQVGQVPMPNPAGDLAKVYPNLSQTNTAASQAILSKLRGELSPETLNALQDNAARFGVESGMPGSNAVPGSLAFNRNQRDLGRTVEDVQSQGVQQYNQTLPTVSGTQTVAPELQTSVNYQNAVSAAAPNPTAAAQYAKSIFDEYMKKLGGGDRWMAQTSDPSTWSSGMGNLGGVRTNFYNPASGETKSYNPRPWG